MQKILTVSTLILMMSSTIAAPLISETKLKLSSPDGRTDVSKVSATLAVSCKYESGLFFPETKSCGNKLINLKTTSDGVVLVPSVEKLNGIRASKTSNYSLNLTLQIGEEWLGSLSTSTAKGINNFKFDNKVLSIYEIDGGEFDLTVGTSSLFGSDLSKEDKASAFVSLKAKKDFSYFSEIVLNSPMLSSWMRVNTNSSNSPELLKDSRSVVLGKMSHLTFNPEREQLVISGSYVQMDGYTVLKRLSSEVTVEASPAVLSEVKSIELK